MNDVTLDQSDDTQTLETVGALPAAPIGFDLLDEVGRGGVGVGCVCGSIFLRVPASGRVGRGMEITREGVIHGGTENYGNSRADWWTRRDPGPEFRWTNGAETSGHA